MVRDFHIQADKQTKVAFKSVNVSFVEFLTTVTLKKHTKALCYVAKHAKINSWRFVYKTQKLPKSNFFVWI